MLAQFFLAEWERSTNVFRGECLPCQISAFPTAQWDSLMVPISMAFFFRSTPDARVVAFYPSPAGATESLLPLETWKDIEAANPVSEGNGS